MSAQVLLAEVGRRGLRVELDGAGVPHLRGDGSQVTPGLLRALKAYRDEVLESLGGGASCREAEPQPAKVLPPWNPDAYVRTIPLHTPRLREWLWPNGLVVADQPWCRSTEPSVTSPAWWWRYQGESGWRPVPGTPGEAADVPPGEHLEEG